MYNFRMLNRRPLELPALDTLVPLVSIQFKRYTNQEAREELRQMQPLLYNPQSGWYFALSSKGIEKMPIEQYDQKENITLIHLAAVVNLDRLVSHAVLAYSKLEPFERINSFGCNVAGNKRIKANHRFYVGAWIDEKPYSVRLLIREYMDGTVELGEEAKAYALNIKEMKMREAVSGTSVLPASHGVTTAPIHSPLIKAPATGNISVPPSRCGAIPPTDAGLTEAKIAQGEHKSKLAITKIPLQRLIEANLKEGEEPLYQQREVFDYSKTGTDRVETRCQTIFPQRRTEIDAGELGRT